MQFATLGGGCFWCLEAVFERMIGVTKVESGYCGGDDPSPTYRSVCSGVTGHAEVVRLTFDPTVVSYEEVLDVFFTVHDPTTLNRQGNDAGTQYRSAIFWHDGNQKAIAEKKIRELTTGKYFGDPIVTEVLPAPQFFKAEGYHQGYFQANPNQPYCTFVVSPKVAKFRSQFLRDFGTNRFQRSAST